MSDSVSLWTVAHQEPLSMGFPRQEYRSCHFLPQLLPHSRPTKDLSLPSQEKSRSLHLGILSNPCYQNPLPGHLSASHSPCYSNNLFPETNLHNWVMDVILFLMIPSLFHIFFLIELYLLYNVVLVSPVEQRELAICICFLLSLAPIPSPSHPPRSSRSIKLSSLCYIAASHELFTLHSVMCVCQCSLWICAPHPMSTSLLLGIYPEKTTIQKDTCTPKVHYCTIYNSQNLEAT